MRFSRYSLLLIFVFVGLLNLTIRANQNTLPSNSNLMGIAFGNGKYVAVGTAGTIITSTDGVKWSAGSSGITEDIISVVWGKDKYVAVSKDTTILYSFDGIAWDTILFHNIFRAVTWGNNLFVALGNYGQILTSPDGISWTERASNNYDSYMSAIWTGTKFVVVGSSWPQMDIFYSVIVSSNDGIVWTRQVYTSGNGSLYPPFSSIIWNNQQYYAIANNERIYASSDLNTWTQCPIDETFIYAMTFGNDRITTVGSYGRILNSSDGLTWTLVTPFVIPDLGGLNAVAWYNNQIIAVGDGCTIWLSSDGIHWTNRSLYISGVTGPPNSKSMTGTGNNIKIYGNHMHYCLGQPARIMVKLYTIQGSLVKTLVDNKYSTGHNVVYFPSTIVNGQYILSFQAGQNNTNLLTMIAKDCGGKIVRACP
jgi:hypothetical protein